MKRFTNFNNVLTILGFLITVLGLIIQLIPTIPQVVKNWILGSIIVVLFICLIALLILYFKKRTILKRKKLIKSGQQLILNTQYCAVLFGGDLSWVEDYLDCLKKIIQDGKIVEVYFPNEKFDNASEEAQTIFANRIGQLHNIHANIYYFEKDIGLRCILIDPETFPPTDDLKILVSKRIKKNNKNALKNKYRISLLNSSREETKERATSYLANYLLIKLIRKKL